MFYLNASKRYQILPRDSTYLSLSAPCANSLHVQNPECTVCQQISTPPYAHNLHCLTNKHKTPATNTQPETDEDRELGIERAAKHSE